MEITDKKEISSKLKAKRLLFKFQCSTLNKHCKNCFIITFLINILNTTLFIIKKYFVFFIYLNSPCLLSRTFPVPAMWWWSRLWGTDLIVSGLHIVQNDILNSVCNVRNIPSVCVCCQYKLMRRIWLSLNKSIPVFVRMRSIYLSQDTPPDDPVWGDRSKQCHCQCIDHMSGLAITDLCLLSAGQR